MLPRVVYSTVLPVLTTSFRGHHVHSCRKSTVVSVPSLLRPSVLATKHHVFLCLLLSSENVTLQGRLSWFKFVED